MRRHYVTIVGNQRSHFTTKAGAVKWIRDELIVAWPDIKPSHANSLGITLIETSEPLEVNGVHFEAFPITINSVNKGK